MTTVLLCKLNQSTSQFNIISTACEMDFSLHNSPNDVSQSANISLALHTHTISTSSQFSTRDSVTTREARISRQMPLAFNNELLHSPTSDNMFTSSCHLGQSHAST